MKNPTMCHCKMLIFMLIFIHLTRASALKCLHCTEDGDPHKWFGRCPKSYGGPSEQWQKDCAGDNPMCGEYSVSKSLTDIYRRISARGCGDDERLYPDNERGQLGCYKTDRNGVAHIFCYCNEPLCNNKTLDEMMNSNSDAVTAQLFLFFSVLSFVLISQGVFLL